MFFKFNFIVIIIFFSLVQSANGQKLSHISLDRFIDTSLQNSGLMQTHMVQTKDSFVVKNYTNYIIKEFYFQPLQYYYNLLQQGLMNETQFNLYQRRYNEKGNFFCSENIENKIQVLISLDSQNTKTVIFDINKNRDFTDDSAYIFKEENNKQKITAATKGLPILNLQIMDCLDNNLFYDTIYIRPYPYSSAFTYTDSIENKYYLMIKNAMSKKGIINFNGDRYSIIISSGRPLPLYNIADTKIFITSLGERKKDDQYYYTGDTVKLKSGAIRLDSVSKFGDAIYYEEIVNSSFFDTWKSKVPNMSMIDVYGKMHNIKFDRKTTLIDFWGTWCQPCIENIPKLKQLYKKYKNENFQMVSIAYDKKDDLNKLKMMIKNKHITWLNIFQDIDDESMSSLVKKFKVDLFPTFILIDEKGDIIFRSKSDTDDFEMLMNKLNKLLL